MAAEKAAAHIAKKLTELDTIMSDYGITSSQYALSAGFNETLIRQGIGYLQQIHVFSCVDIGTGSPLLTRLGKLCSPYSAELFTPSARTKLPVFKQDSSMWDFDEFTFATASKLIDHGLSGTAHPTLVSFSTGQSQGSNTPSSNDFHAGFSHGKEKSGKDEDSIDRDSGNEEEDSGRDDSNGDNSDNHSNAGDLTESSSKDTGPHMIFFEVVSELCSIHNRQVFQYVKSEGDISIQVCPLYFTSTYFY